MGTEIPETIKELQATIEGLIKAHKETEMLINEPKTHINAAGIADQSNETTPVK